MFPAFSLIIRLTDKLVGICRLTNWSVCEERQRGRFMVWLAATAIAARRCRATDKARMAALAFAGCHSDRPAASDRYGSCTASLYDGTM
jgi:hypothetical protein